MEMWDLKTPQFFSQIKNEALPLDIEFFAKIAKFGVPYSQAFTTNSY